MAFNNSLKLAPIDENLKSSISEQFNHNNFFEKRHFGNPSPSIFNDQQSMISNFSKMLMSSEPSLIRQSGRILKPQIDRRIEQLELCQIELEKKCQQVTERELGRIQNLRNRFDQKSRELMADIDREFQEKKSILREKVYRESEKRQKLDYSEFGTVENGQQQLKKVKKYGKNEKSHESKNFPKTSSCRQTHEFTPPLLPLELVVPSSSASTTTNLSSALGQTSNGAKCTLTNWILST